MKLQFTKQELFALIVVSLMSFLANLPDGALGHLINRKLLLATLVAVVVIAMFRYLKVLLLMIISVLAIGANLPHELALSLGVSQPAMVVCLGILVALTMANRMFNMLPTSADAFETPDDEEDLEVADPREQMLTAIAHGDMSTLRRLIAANVGVNFTLNGTTPLHAATERGYSNIVQLLIEQNANLLALNAQGQTPLDVALAVKKFARTTNILYEATIPLLTAQGQYSPEA